VKSSQEEKPSTDDVDNDPPIYLTIGGGENLRVPDESRMM
jgi:hypothetical protein